MFIAIRLKAQTNRAYYGTGLRCFAKINFRSLRRLTILLGMGWICFCVLAQAICLGQPNSSSSGAKIDLSRYELFQMLLEEQNLVISNLGESLADPQQSVIVAIGDKNVFSQSLLNKFYNFSQAGGAILLACNHECQTRYGVIQPGPVLSSDSAVLDREVDDILQIRQINLFHPLTSGVSELAVAKTGWLELPLPLNSDWQVAALLPNNAFPRAGRGQPLLATGDIPQPRRGDGRVVLSAATSLFSNHNLWQSENAIFVIRIANYLGFQRSRLCFIVDSQQMDTYRHSPLLQRSPKQLPPINPSDVPLQEMDAQTLLKLANGVLSEVEQSNVLNETLRYRPRNIRPATYAQMLSIVLMAICVLWICWKLIRRQSQFRLPLPFARRVSPAFNQHRLQASKQQRKLAAEALAREFFRDCTGTDEPTVWRQYCETCMSKPVAQASPSSLRSTLPELLGIAIDGSKNPISTDKLIRYGECMCLLRELKSSKSI